MKLQKEMLRLYAVTDSKWLGKQTLAQAVERAIQGGVTLVQYREKHLTGAAYAKEAAEVAAVCRRYGVPFLVNDRVEEALALGADGVHIGQKDGDPAEIRRRLGAGKILGVTAKTVAQAQAAQAAGADYLGVGAVFPTSTKADVIGIELEQLREIARSVTIPVIAIGGINAGNITALKNCSLAGVAVVSGIFGQENITRACARLSALSGQILGGVKV